jgi:hypothetical protein
MKTSSIANPAHAKPLNPSDERATLRIGRASLLLLSILVVSQAPVLYGQSPSIVSLTPDTCPVVRDGDIVTFAFNPRFDVPSAVTGLRNLELKFSHEGRPDPANVPEAEFTLRTVPLRGEYEAPGASMVVGSGSSTQFRFRTNLRSTARGRFYLVAITGAPFLARGYEGETPKIVNAPLRERLCLQVTPPY